MNLLSPHPTGSATAIRRSRGGSSHALTLSYVLGYKMHNGDMPLFANAAACRCGARCTCNPSSVWRFHTQQCLQLQRFDICRSYTSKTPMLDMEMRVGEILLLRCVVRRQHIVNIPLRTSANALQPHAPYQHRSCQKPDARQLQLRPPSLIITHSLSIG
jgi:hypothetical protein